MIVQGDNGVIVEIDISDENGIVKLETIESIQATVKIGERVFVKPCIIEDANKGKCSFTLNSNDLIDHGNYSYQITVSFNNGGKYSSNIKTFPVVKRLS